MIVAVITMGVMEMAVDKIVDMVSVRHGFVPAARPVYMIRLVARTAMFGRASIRIFLRDFDDVFVNVIAMHVMQVAVMQIIDMAIMLDGCVTAAGSMLMWMVFVMWQAAF